MVSPWKWSLTRNGPLTHGSDEPKVHARVTTTDTFKGIEKLETDLWEAADKHSQFRDTPLGYGAAQCRRSQRSVSTAPASAHTAA